MIAAINFDCGDQTLPDARATLAGGAGARYADVLLRCSEPSLCAGRETGIPEDANE
jgi:hypothetical protein